jgi:hypothetical protein
MLKKLKHWWKTVIYEEYHLTVWFSGGSVIAPDGSVATGKTKKEYKLKSINKKTSTHIVGKDLDGKYFEIKTVEPFDYHIVKVY